MMNHSAHEVKLAAEGLSRACHARTLRDLYDDVAKEGIPDWAKELLNKLK